ncbi:MAG: tripartite tricarboxylate transporter TctB family protein [Thermodesulfobacteriota bacterium]
MFLATRNQKSGFFWLAAGVTVSYVAVGYGLGTMREPGPGYLAFLTGFVISALSLILILGDLRAKVREPLRELFRENSRRVLYTVLALVLYTLLLPYLGFVVCSVILLYGMIFFGGKPNHLVAGGVAIGASVLTFYLFSGLLQVNLPVGVLGQWISGRLP